jgi:Ca2+-binding RTX toxin-like protein
MWRIHRRLLLGLVAATFAVLAAPAPTLAAGPPGDIIFVLDESGSMADEIADVEARVADIVAGLSNSIDARYALVSFGGAPPGQAPGAPFARTNFTDGAGLASALSSAGSYPGSGDERGLYATQFAMHGVSGARPGAATCVVLLSDEDTDTQIDLPTDLSGARDALKDRNAAWFGIVTLGLENTSETYGPSPGSLAAESGGTVFDIQAFRSDASAVLNALLSKCAAHVIENSSLAAFSATPTSGVAPLTVLFKGQEDPSISSSHWDFGDGESSTGTVVSHVYTVVGEHTATHTVKDLTGKTTTSTVKITVRANTQAVLPSDCTILGTLGNDTLVGTPGNDVICGFGGNDVIRGGGGNDVVFGGLGADKMFGGPGNDRLVGERGNDALKGGPGDDTLKGGAGADRLWGGAGKDVLRGGAGLDILAGGPGVNRLFGERGNDTLLGGAAADSLNGGPGTDRFFARDGGPDRLWGGAGNDRARVDSDLDQVRGIEHLVP